MPCVLTWYSDVPCWQPNWRRWDGDMWSSWCGEVFIIVVVVIPQRFSAINILWTACELMRMMRYAAEGLTYCQSIFCSPTKAVTRMLVLLVIFVCLTCSCCFPQLECYCKPSPWWQLDWFYTRVVCWAYLHNIDVVRLSQRQRSRCLGKSSFIAARSEGNKVE